MRRARVPALIVLTLICGWTSLLPAQATPSEPRLLLTVLAGYRVGRPLWILNHQPFAVLVPGMPINDTAVVASPGLYDTLNLEREFVPSFVLGVSGTYFPGPHLGIQGEFAFLSMGMESHCAMRQSQPPYPGDLDPELCASLDRQNIASSAVTASFGVVGRLTPGGGVYPYARANAGVLARTRSAIEMVGTYSTPSGLASALVLADPNPTNTTLQLTIGAGVAVSTGAGYQLWMEARDVLAQIPVVTGPADPSSTSGVLVPPTGNRFVSNYVFLIGLDVVFEKQRRKRY
jgi:hypothetical protein